MHNHVKEHEEFLRKAVKDMGITDLVYITENAYDGGYEVRVGTTDFFVDYEAAEEQDQAYIKERMKNYVA
jgi:hypothetical protein